MFKRIKYLRYILLIFIFFVYSKSFSYAYSEDFNSPIDESIWSIENSGGLHSVDGWLNFQQLDGRNFPYIYNTLAFPINITSENIIEFEIQFSKVGDFGDGFGIADVPVPPYMQINSLDAIKNYFLFHIWQDVHSPYFHVRTSLCPLESPNCSESQLIYSSSSTDLGSHTVRIIEDNGYYKFIFDDELLFESAHTNRLPLYIWGGHPEVTTNSFSTWSEFSINYIRHNGVAASPFPHYSQLDPIWKDDEYDHASSWAEEGDREIEEWGCAVTSAAMILKNYEVNHPETNEITTPQNLNNWLSSQPDGYIRNGLTNWLAITRYAHLSELAGYSPTSLEYVRTDYDAETVTTPTIAKTNYSHFIVLSGEDGDDWIVNDPLATESGRTAKIGSLLNTNTFVPSNTDLSYMMFVLEPGNTLALYDELGNLLTTEGMVESLEDGSEVQIIYYRQPLTGGYRAVITNPEGETTHAEMYFYNEAGELEKVDDELLGGESKAWQIDYYKSGEEIASHVELDITPPTISWVEPSSGVVTNGVVNLKASCNETCDYINFWWREESESYSNTAPDRRYHYEYDNGEVFSWSLDTHAAERWGGDLSYEMIDGTYYLYAAGKDLAGNWARTPEISLVVDHTAPSKVKGMRILDENGTDLGCSGTTNNRRITIDWDDSPEPDFDHYLYSIKDHEDFRTLTTSSLTGDIRDLDGLYKYRVKAVDEVGNVGEASEWCEVTLDRISPTQPGSPWTSPNPTNGLLQNWLWGESKDDGSQVNGYYNRIYNTLTGTPLSDWLWLGKVLGTSTELTDGQWQMIVKSVDNAENESGIASSEVLLVDTLLPTLISKTSLPSTWYNSVQKVVFQYGDLHLLQSYEDPWCEINIESSSSYCYVTPYICDTAGNCNNTQVFSDAIGLDMTKPTVSLSEWGSRLSGTASDSLSGVERVEIKLTTPGESEITVTAVGTTDWTYTIEPAPIGNYLAKITSYDKAGNASEAITKEYEIGVSEPAGAAGEGNREVLGASTESYTQIASSIESPSPSPSFLPSPTPSSNPQILGKSDDKTETEKRMINWWWLLTLLPVPLIWIYYRRK